MLSALVVPLVVLLMLPAVGATAEARVSEVGRAADPEVRVPPARYESAFTRYRPMREAEVRPWREVNDRVGHVGGWRTYGREAVSEQNQAGDGARSKEPSTGPGQQTTH